jgi:cytochrome c peroxidase
MTHNSRVRMQSLASAGLFAMAIFGIAETALGSSAQQPSSSSALLTLGINPHPVRLVRRPVLPLSAMAQLGQRVFFDRTLSSSGSLSCADCHSPQHAYGPPNDGPVMNGGATLMRQGVRAVPSLMYLERSPGFTVGPDIGEGPDGSATPAPLPAPKQPAARARKTLQNVSQSATNLVPQGGLFWDGRVDTLQEQALEPLLNPLEMDGGSVARIAAKLRRATYAPLLTQLFGSGVFANPRVAVSEALFAVGRYQIEDVAFHSYSSKYDYWLEGRARFSPAEARGYRIFNDPQLANCAGCHLDKPGADGLPPLFTDHQYEALGVPRNTKLAVNRNPAYFDLGICGPLRSDMKAQTQYCGMFLTPTLRNAATRRAFFHNGVYHSLSQVLDFYDFRDVEPQRIYRSSRSGKVEKFDDLPARDRANVDTIDPPFNRAAGEAPPMTRREEQDVIAFLRTLTDGYRPKKN